MMNYFQGQSVKWLLERRTALQEALARATGSQTAVALAPGMRDEFASLTQDQIITQLQRVMYALFCADPDNYKNPYTQRAMKISTAYPSSY